jgi:hypothetical protein
VNILKKYKEKYNYDWKSDKLKIQIDFKIQKTTYISKLSFSLSKSKLFILLSSKILSLYTSLTT